MYSNAVFLTRLGCDGFKILGRSRAIRGVLDLVRDVADSDATVLIRGENGTEKELLARAIHHGSHRSAESFVPVNVAALPPDYAESMLFGRETPADESDKQPPGWCEAADRGTLMLDEIGEMAIPLQAKLARYLKDGGYMRVGGCELRRSNVRVIAATSRDPEKLITDQKLRRDLYHRLNVFPIEMPALRQRREDIPMLASTLLERSANTHSRPVTGISEDAMQCLVSYHWPGNIRQMENFITRMVLTARDPVIGVDLLPEEIRAASGLQILEANRENMSLIEVMEKRAIVAALKDPVGTRSLPPNGWASAKRRLSQDQTFSDRTQTDQRGNESFLLIRTAKACRDP